MAAVAEFGGIGLFGAASAFLTALGVGNGVGDFLGDGGAAAAAGAGVLLLLVDLTGLHDLVLDGCHIRLVDHLFLDGDGLGLRQRVTLDGLHRQGVVAGFHILRQRGAGLRVKGEVRGVALAVRQGDGGLHTQQRAAVGVQHVGVLFLRVGKDGQGGIHQLVEHHAHILLDDRDLRLNGRGRGLRLGLIDFGGHCGQRRCRGGGGLRRGLRRGKAGRHHTDAQPGA